MGVVGDVILSRFGYNYTYTITEDIVLVWLPPMMQEVFDPMNA